MIYRVFFTVVAAVAFGSLALLGSGAVTAGNTWPSPPVEPGAGHTDSTVEAGVSWTAVPATPADPR